MNMFVAGMTGTGKSYMIHSLLRNVDKPIYAVSNKIEDYYQLERVSGKKFKLVEVESGKRIKKLPDDNIFFTFGFITHEEKVDFMDDLALHIMQKRNVVLYVDEAHDVLAAQGAYSKGLESLIAGARAKGIHVIIISQRPQNVKKSVINNCKWIVTFKLNEYNSAEAMVKHMQNVDVEDIKNLNLYEFFVYNAYTGKLTKERL